MVKSVYFAGKNSQGDLSNTVHQDVLIWLINGRRIWYNEGMPIRKTTKGYKIANTPGYSKTLSAAKKRLRAIKANQAKK